MRYITDAYSDAWQAGRWAGYDTRNYATAYGIETELSFYKYKEVDGSRTDYENGFWEGVQQYDAEEEFNGMLDEWEGN